MENLNVYYFLLERKILLVVLYLVLRSVGFRSKTHYEASLEMRMGTPRWDPGCTPLYPGLMHPGQGPV